MRTTFEIRQSLENAAAASGRSLAQEAEARIERSFTNQQFLLDALEPIFGEGVAGVLLLIGEIMKTAGRYAGHEATRTPEGSQRWWANPYAFDQVRNGVALALSALAPAGEISPPRTGSPDYDRILEHLGERIALQYLREIAEAPTQSEHPASQPRRFFGASELRRYLGKDLASQIKNSTGRAEDARPS